ncbi:hypothetical protein DSLASN_27400 [Desulfoluna limicola]|uniref:Sigma-54 factor interaction domain-containing protein n=1 Tax=Desulfoluna limicola TaxID=2810562 RepID=A0ABN6F5T4_9BACT|nr:sigma-54 dependent transcriptional regulator [Desulfoluna limicola]BCS97108.1 hypothetical protein DSLASN_27400 [Desulfoluna limicola]
MDTGLVGVSSDIQKIRDIIHLISSDASLNVLITGETGVGKEVVARALYESSPRKQSEFVKVNCAAIPDALLESELFGVEQGAYTGANKQRKGKFELADGGVLFLDEIGDMSFHLQAKLLHVLQSGEYNRLGSESNMRSNTWVISATNHNLKQKILAKEFREDLYYRLNMVRINISPLRERPEDIPELITHYTEVYNTKYPNSKTNHLTSETVESLCRYPWPGNVRQLISVLQRILILGCDEEAIDDLRRETIGQQGLTVSDAATPIYGQIMDEIRDIVNKTPDSIGSFSLKTIKKTTSNIVEKEVISQILGMTNWNRTHASKILKISYKTLLTKIDQLEITRPN